MVKKTPFYADYTNKFSTENLLNLHEMLQLALKWIKMYVRVFSKVLENDILGYFAFLQFYGCRNASKGCFLGKNHYILPKIAVFAHLDCCKIGKKQNIQKTLHEVVVNTLRYIFTHF